MKMKLGLIAMWGFVLGQQVTLMRFVQRLDTAIPLSLLAIVMIVLKIREVKRSAVKSLDVTKH